MKLPKATVFDLADTSFALVEDGGICVDCGEPHDDIKFTPEPHKCLKCGTLTVYSAEFLINALV